MVEEDRDGLITGFLDIFEFDVDFSNRETFRTGNICRFISIN